MPTKKGPSPKKPRSAKRKRTTQSPPSAPTSHGASPHADTPSLEAQAEPCTSAPSAPSASPEPIAQDIPAEAVLEQPRQAETAPNDTQSQPEQGLIARSKLRELAEWYINSSEQFALKALTLQQQTAAQAQDTPWGPFFEFQYSLTSRWIKNTVSLSRTFWHLEEEKETS